MHKAFISSSSHSQQVLGDLSLEGCLFLIWNAWEWTTHLSGVVWGRIYWHYSSSNMVCPPQIYQIISLWKTFVLTCGAGTAAEGLTHGINLFFIFSLIAHFLHILFWYSWVQILLITSFNLHFQQSSSTFSGIICTAKPEPHETWISILSLLNTPELFQDKPKVISLMKLRAERIWGMEAMKQQFHMTRRKGLKFCAANCCEEEQI